MTEESPEIASKDPVAIDDEEKAPVASQDAFAEEQDEAQFGGVSDLELEEVPLSYLEEDIDAASDIVGTDIDAIAAMDLADLIASGNDVPAVAAAEENTQSPVDLISDDDVMANTEMPRAEASTLNSRFEAVSDAAL